MIARYGIYWNRYFQSVLEFSFLFLSILFLRKRIDGTKLVCENSNVAIIPIISRNKYQERLSNDFIAKKRIESNIHFVPSFNTPFNDCGKPNGFPRFIAGNFNIPPWNTCISTLCSEPIRAMPTPPMLPDSDPGFFLFLSSFFLAEFGHTSRIFKTGPLVELIFKASSSNRYLNRDCLNRPPEIHSNAKGTPEFPPRAVINSRRFDPRV